ncbi:hypothetical protein SALWKB2_1726 [Snodgrassella alvi wkB2]|nr:hypothetical protein SALWKB2_1726 [Snodgrassella alvi wkB2]PIT31616.1 hypothetical protein BHC50_07610 [Snodgrassella alvi]PIT36793.1 hypothetical protein BHC42_01395 [Snodgrassella alvi]
MNRPRQTFFQASIFTMAMMVFSSIIEHAWPEVNNVWLVGWIAQWVFVFIVIWLFDIIAVSTTSAVIYTLVVGIVYYFYQNHIFALVAQWLGK